MYFAEKRQLLDYEQHRLYTAATQGISREKQRLAAAAASLDAMSPLKVLARGYSIVHDDKGKVVTSEKEVAAGDRLRVRLHEGEVRCIVE